MTTSPAVEVTHLHKTYGETVAVDDVSLTVAEGEILGVLGPNGAGKTTTVECVIGLRHPDGGSLRVLGLDPERQAAQLHQVVGVQLQFSAQPDKLRVKEVLDLYRSFYRRPADVGNLVEGLGLAGKLHTYYRSLSGGQRQRLSIALALIDQGRVVATDTPAALAAQVKGAKLVSFAPSGPFDDRLLLDLPEVRTLEHNARRVVVTGSGDLVNAAILTLAAAGVTAHDVEMGTSSLEDAFVELTGRHVHHTGAPT